MIEANSTMVLIAEHFLPPSIDILQTEGAGFSSQSAGFLTHA
jgi:hypothetical protein